VAVFIVTGCAGFIGSHLVDALLARGDAVRGIDSFTDYYSRAAKEHNLAEAGRSDRFTMFVSDVNEIAWDEVTSGADGLFHLAAQPGVRGSWGSTFAIYARENVLATQRVFEAAAASGLRVVWASSSSVYGNALSYPTLEDVTARPISPYGVTKRCCEDLASAYHQARALDYVALRYFTVYGPRQRPDMAFTRIVEALAAGTEFTLFGSGEQTRDVTYVEDAVAATVAAMERAPSATVYNVGGGAEIALRDVIDLCERLSGKKLAIRREPVATGDVDRTAADTTRARHDLGWRPRTALEDGLAAQLSSMGLSAHVPDTDTINS
jgi:nucleoside-diphosphate-sugar epimerase